MKKSWPLVKKIFLVIFIIHVCWFLYFIFTNFSGAIEIKEFKQRFLIFVAIAALIAIGFLSSNFLTSRIFSLFDTWLERTPGIKFIYSSIKDFFEAFAGNKRKFKKAVLVSIFQPDVFQLGFITDEDASEFGLLNYVAVYVPNSYAVAGQLYMVPKEKVRVLDDVSASDVLKYAISGGVAEVEEDRHVSHES